MNNTFPEEAHQRHIENIIKEVLGEEYINLFITNFVLSENDEQQISNIFCDIKFSNEWKDEQIEGHGTGAVNALVNGMMKTFSQKFFSLEQVELDDFAVRVKFASNRRSTDAPVEIKLALRNQRNQRIYFHATSRSMVIAAVSVIRKAFEYLINAERAILQLREDIAYATLRNRQDLASKYTKQMTELVRILSYENAIKKNQT